MRVNRLKIQKKLYILIVHILITINCVIKARFALLIQIK